MGKWRPFSRGTLGDCRGNLSNVFLVSLASRSGRYGANWLEQAKGRVHKGVVWGFSLVGHMVVNPCVSRNMNFSLITMVS